MKLALLLLVGLCACNAPEAEARDATWQSTHSTTTPNTFKLESEKVPTDASAGPAAGASGALPPDATAKPPSSDDHGFIFEAVQGGLFEIESSSIALDKNVSESIREFAQMMVDDHKRSNQALMEIVQRKNAKAPTEMSREQKLEIEELQRTTGSAFDRRYYLAQVSAHDQAIALFERAAERCEDSDLREFAAHTLPTLLEHRRYLEQHPM